MPRKMRVQYPGAMYHVMSRGDQRDDILLDDVDRYDFIKTLADACLKTDWLVHAFCLMNNHYHLVIETPSANLAAGMAWLQSTYTIRRQRGQTNIGVKPYIFDSSLTFWLGLARPSAPCRAKCESNIVAFLALSVNFLHWGCG